MEVNKNSKIFIWTGIGLVALVTIIAISQKNQSPITKPKSKSPNSEPQKKESETDDEGEMMISSQTELPLLEERIYIAENRQKFRDQKVEGYNEFIERTKKALDETTEKKLIFYNTDTEYVLVKMSESGQELVAIIKK